MPFPASLPLVICKRDFGLHVKTTTSLPFKGSSFFVDIGNVFSKDCGIDQSNINCSELDLGELRYSYGVGVTWITQLGPMSLAIAAPSNEGPLDETESFQFEIGTQF